MRTYANYLLFEDVLTNIPGDAPIIQSIANILMTPTVKIVEEDCGTLVGNIVPVDYTLEGRTYLPTNAYITIAMINTWLAQGITSVKTRTISSCASVGGICVSCYLTSVKNINVTLTGVLSNSALGQFVLVAPGVYSTTGVGNLSQGASIGLPEVYTNSTTTTFSPSSVVPIPAVESISSISTPSAGITSGIISVSSISGTGTPITSQSFVMAGNVGISTIGSFSNSQNITIPGVESLSTSGIPVANTSINISGVVSSSGAGSIGTQISFSYSSGAIGGSPLSGQAISGNNIDTPHLSILGSVYISTSVGTLIGSISDEVIEESITGVSSTNTAATFLASSNCVLLDNILNTGVNPVVVGQSYNITGDASTSSVGVFGVIGPVNLSGTTAYSAVNTLSPSILPIDKGVVGGGSVSSGPISG